MADSDSPYPTLESMAAELPLVIGQLRRRLRRAGSQGELSVSHMAVLSRLAKEGAMSAAQLARTESMRPQSMGVLLSRLEALGLVERHAHPSDRRQTIFDLTPSGAAANRQRRMARQEWLLEAFSTLSAEEQQVLAAAVPLLKRLGDGA